MRTDNDGEGGIFALSALAVNRHAARRGAPWVFLLIGLFGAALLYGDGMITPSISVLAAVEGPRRLENPFYRLAPDWALYPLVVLATLATVLASQALISGAYSLTHQAMQLGYCPRVEVRHTSATHIGQIYVPSVNWFLVVACIGLVLGFRHSANLAAAYGVAVTTTMVMTTALFFVVARRRLGLPSALVVPLCAAFFAVDMAFFLATGFKIPEGGWFPLLVAAAVFTVLTTWRTGRLLVGERLTGHNPSLRLLVDTLLEGHRPRVPGTGAYLYATPGVTPPALLANLHHNRTLHEQVLVISVVTEKRPRVPTVRRAEVTDLGCGFHQVVVRFGFLDEPDLPRALLERIVMHTGTDLAATHYFVGREALRVTRLPGMVWWRERLFAVLLRNASSAANHFRLPADQTVELGMVVEL